MKNFKISLLAMALVGGMGMSAAHAVDGTINFTGTVTADTCTVDINDQTNPTLNLGTVNTTDLKVAGDTGPATNFALNLSACPTSVTAASVTFDGNVDSTMNTAFANEATTGAAGNVGVQIYDSAIKAVTPATAVDVSSFIDATSHAASIPFTARMIAVDDVATAGALISHADYTVSYQ